MRAKALSSITLPVAMLSVLLGFSGPTQADPGPNCTLTTPTDKAECATVTMVIGARTTSLDPTAGGPSTDYQPMYPQQGLLYRYDINLVPRMDLIEAETISPDGLTITQTVRKGAKYSDGTPVLAEDAVYAYERWKAAGLSSAFIAPITGAKASGNSTIIWTLSSPYPDFKHAIASHFLGIHPKKQIVEKLPLNISRSRSVRDHSYCRSGHRAPTSWCSRRTHSTGPSLTLMNSALWSFPMQRRDFWRFNRVQLITSTRCL